MTQEEKARMFAALHSNTFVLPNAWDAASARIFEEEKFQAIEQHRRALLSRWDIETASASRRMRC